MKFEISKNTFSEIVKKVSRGINAKSIIPILSGILVEVTDEGLTLTGSDSDMSIRSFISNDDESGLEVSREGTVVLPARELTQIVRSMPDSITVEKTDDLNKVIISSGKSKFTLNGMPAEEYPKIKLVPTEGFSIKGVFLKSMIQKTVFATTDSETRPVLTGANMFFEQERIGMVATDSHVRLVLL